MKETIKIEITAEDLTKQKRVYIAVIIFTNIVYIGIFIWKGVL